MNESEFTLKPPGSWQSGDDLILPGECLLHASTLAEQPNFTPKLGNDREVVAIK